MNITEGTANERAARILFIANSLPAPKRERRCLNIPEIMAEPFEDRAH
jgi:hypothetical protein